MNEPDYRHVHNAFLEKIGSPFRLGQDYRCGGMVLTATRLISGVHPRVVFSDGNDRNARNGKFTSRGSHQLDIDLNDDQKAAIKKRRA